ncbi:hypothetical protein QIH01_04660 [Brevibacillus brevis]|nr:hypothetical protein QIH01_04660 [Brevibacillus brevis]
MHYQITNILTPIFIENVGEYTIKYDDLNYYSVWFKDHCLMENATSAGTREFCEARLNRNGKIVYIYHTHFLYIRGETYSKYLYEEQWHRRYHFPWIGFYPVPQKVNQGTPLYESVFNDFIEAEKLRKISRRYKPYFNIIDREKYKKI